MSTQDQKEVYRESKILESLKHPNIIRFREVYHEKSNLRSKLCIVMDYADGGDLQNCIKTANGKYFPEQQILDWFSQLCHAVKYIHSMKVLHRDIKTQNIFLTKEGKCLLGDFGVSRTLSETRACANTQIGTPFYMSPEIIEGKEYSYESDVWSLGVVLYELCALKVPFNANNIYALSLRIVKGSCSPLPSKFSKDLRSLVKEMLQVNPSKRPSINQILNIPLLRKCSEGHRGVKAEKALCLIKAREYRLEKEKFLQGIVENKQVKVISCTPISEPLIKKNMKFEKIRQNLIKKIESKKNLHANYSSETTANNTEDLEIKGAEAPAAKDTSTNAVHSADSLKDEANGVKHISNTQELSRSIKSYERNSHSLEVEGTVKEFSEKITQIPLNGSNNESKIAFANIELTDQALIKKYLESKFTKQKVAAIINNIKSKIDCMSIQAYHQGIENCITEKELCDNIGLFLALCQ
eukprot:TRINITY_DN4782_c0_g2_i1.p1 TRINITY_DN4782_c0_g2~~TRINITY_DN4782_c0_g2_i1.p1  ORF type:complete len:468 (-),score=79.94 TRINITY_DN4782_c0_g2_i1:44-1447(-)